MASRAAPVDNSSTEEWLVPGLAPPVAKQPTRSRPEPEQSFGPPRARKPAPPPPESAADFVPPSPPPRAGSEPPAEPPAADLGPRTEPPPPHQGNGSEQPSPASQRAVAEDLLLELQRSTTQATNLAARAAECAAGAAAEAAQATSDGVEVAVALARLEVRMDVMEKSVARRLAASERHVVEWATFEGHADRVEMRLRRLNTPAAQR